MILAALLLALLAVTAAAYLKHSRPPSPNAKAAPAAAAVAAPPNASESRERDLDLYCLAPTLLTAAERSFYGVLEFVRPEGVSIVCKVRMADVISIRRGLTAAERQRALNRISAKHVDFVVIRKSDARPLLAIELDDSSHRAESRIERDEFVDAVYDRVGLPVMHVTARAAYEPNEVRRQLEASLAAAACHGSD